MDHVPATQESTKSLEQRQALWQVENWSLQHLRVGGNIGGPLDGYQFNKPSSSRSHLSGHLRQFVPDISYIVERTLSRLTPEEKNMGLYHACPRLLLNSCQRQIGSRTCKTKCPRFVRLGQIKFEWWSDLTLDYRAIRDARTRAGLP